MIDTENGDRKIRLTEKETAILKYLFRAGEKLSAVMSCLTRCGDMIPVSPRTRWKPTSTGCGRKSNAIRRTPRY